MSRVQQQRALLAVPRVPVPPEAEAPPEENVVRASTLGLENGDPIIVASGTTLLYDLYPSDPNFSFGDISVAGKWTVDTAIDTWLPCASIDMAANPDGGYWCGTEASPLPANKTHRITLTGAEIGNKLGYRVDQTNTGTGPELLRLCASTSTPPIASQTIAITRNTATTFTVTSSYPTSGTVLGTGTVGVLFDNRVRFKVTSDLVYNRLLRVQQKGQTNSGLSRGFMVTNAPLELHGVSKTPFTILQGSQVAPKYLAGSTTHSTASAPQNWVGGDKVVYGITEFFEYGPQLAEKSECDLRTLSLTPATASLTVTQGLSRPRWAMLQWYKASGVDQYGRPRGEIVLADPGYTPHHPGVPSVIDERARVANISRNIIIEGLDDAAWNNLTQGRFGGHLMVMGRVAPHIEGVEFRRMGQRGREGRYPIHLHMNSWSMPDGMGFPSDGTYLGPLSGAYIRNCAIHTSAQHGVQLHGVDGVTVTDNVFYDIAGHCFNLEDGSEQDNIVTGNIALRATRIDDDALRQTRFHDFNAAGFWITNPRNVVRDNIAVQCQTGIWLSFAERCFGLSRDVARRPSRIRKLDIGFNYSIGSRIEGARTAGVMSDELGTAILSSGFYWPTDTDTADGRPVPFEFEGFQLYKSFGDPSYQNRAGLPIYKRWIVGDGNRTDFSGSVNKGELLESFVFNESLNVTTRTNSHLALRRGTASYHTTLVPRYCLFHGFSAVYPADTVSPTTPNVGYSLMFSPGGVEKAQCSIAMEDLYMQNPEMGFVNAVGNLFSSGTPGALSRQWSVRIYHTGQAPNGNWDGNTTAAVWDPHGWWGPAGNYVVYRHPFFTHGLSTYQDIEDNPYSVSTPDRLMGFRYLSLANTASSEIRRTFAFTMSKLDSSFAPVAELTFSDTSSINSGLNDKKLSMFQRNGIYKMVSAATPTYGIRYQIENAPTINDAVTVGVNFSGAVPARVYGMTNTTYSYATGFSASDLAARYGVNFTAVSSKEAVVASNGDTYFQDTANNMVWIKSRGGYGRREVMSPTDWNQWQYQLPYSVIVKAV
jgi:hypothetical protein